MAYGKDFNQVAEVDSPTSRINAAGLINSTLEKLWNEGYTAMGNGKYELWNIKLDSIWCILGGDEKAGSNASKDIQDINLKIYEQGSLKSKTGEGFEQRSNPNNSIQYQWLIRKSIYLRQLQNKQGKGTAYASEDDDDIE